ncbi:MAG: hypothetical protein ACYTEV_02165 [Planctomycetota bacterium]|jgi:hypothetical protein
MSGSHTRPGGGAGDHLEAIVDQVLNGPEQTTMQGADVAGDTAAFPEADALELQFAAARVAAAMTDASDPLPAELDAVVRRRLREFALADAAPGAVGAMVHPAAAATHGLGRTVMRFAGGFAAAAVLVVAALLAARAWLAPPPAPATPVEARAALVARATDLVTMRWQGTDHPMVAEARGLGLLSGEIVWSDLEAEGFARVCHLTENDPGTGTYRLWLWNADDPDGVPVDCGRFDVMQSADFTVVRLDPRTPLDRPVRAAVSFARPGEDSLVPEASDLLLVARAVEPVDRRQG